MSVGSRQPAAGSENAVMSGLAPRATEHRQSAFGQHLPQRIACPNVSDAWIAAGLFSGKMQQEPTSNRAIKHPQVNRFKVVTS
ncbi:hypothetical protein MKK84_06500 [Methylobacterium sp. E-065]|uniref:hypothetical protein n=2 Tax=unclassified Methylobacterium TaxID=2615210 RepID=UPI001FBB7ACA|nr:hypothetical protein [Methylobacterium sp. E-065]MCJ2017078.1 hypothetical protein [Methylobacterium sp. E-065]